MEFPSKLIEEAVEQFSQFPGIGATVTNAITYQTPRFAAFAPATAVTARLFVL